MDEIDRRILAALQGGFPLCDRPFAVAGAALGIGEQELIDRIRDLLQRRILTRFGPLFQAERLGGALSLAAMAVPEHRYEEIACLVNSLAAVAHNYRREHALNMWFVIAAESRGQISDAIEWIERATNLPVIEFPKEREYYVGLELCVHP